MGILVALNNWLTPVTVYGIAIAIPFAVLALFVKRSRAAFSYYLLCLSFPVGLAAWIYSAIVLLGHWGVGGLVVGILLGGVGVVPLSLIAVVIHGEWAVMSTIMVDVLLFFVTRIGMLGIVWWDNKQEERKTLRHGEVHRNDPRKAGGHSSENYAAYPVQSILKKASMALRAGQPEDALKLCEDAIDAVFENDDSLELAYVLRHTADINSQLGLCGSAAQQIEKAICIYQEEEEPRQLDLANALRISALNNERILIKTWTRARELYASQNVQAGVDEALDHIKQLHRSTSKAL